MLPAVAGNGVVEASRPGEAGVDGTGEEFCVPGGVGDALSQERVPVPPGVAGRP